jgi:hypothetical protein
LLLLRVTSEASLAMLSGRAPRGFLDTSRVFSCSSCSRPLGRLLSSLQLQTNGVTQ